MLPPNAGDAGMPDGACAFGGGGDELFAGGAFGLLAIGSVAFALTEACTFGGGSWLLGAADLEDAALEACFGVSAGLGLIFARTMVCIGIAALNFSLFLISSSTISCKRLSRLA